VQRQQQQQLCWGRRRYTRGGAVRCYAASGCVSHCRDGARQLV
jgi:hypothetical protein